MASDNEVMECTPECNMNCNMGIDNDDDIIDEQFLNAKTSIIALKSALNKLQQDLKIIERNVSRRQNKVKRERKNAVNENLRNCLVLHYRQRFRTS